MRKKDDRPASQLLLMSVCAHSAAIVFHPSERRLLLLVSSRRDFPDEFSKRTPTWGALKQQVFFTRPVLFTSGENV